MQVLTEAIRTKNVDVAKGWFKSEAWGTVEQLIQAHSMYCTLIMKAVLY